MAAAVAAPAVETTAAVEPAPESVGGESAIEAAEPLATELSGLMPLFVLGGRPADAGPAPARGTRSRG